jgi:hypothetical protein
MMSSDRLEATTRIFGGNRGAEKSSMKSGRQVNLTENIV